MNYKNNNNNNSNTFSNPFSNVNQSIFNNHPLINNSNQYFLEKKYISIHSNARDITKYPSSSEFELILPQEYLNVVSSKLYSWSFPANYNVFSLASYNVTMTFKFIQLYNPSEHLIQNVLLEGIFAALYDFMNTNGEFIVVIEPGFYNPDQMTTELTNKFNESVTNIINIFFDNPENAIKYSEAKNLFRSYERFNIVYYGLVIMQINLYKQIVLIFLFVNLLLIPIVYVKMFYQNGLIGVYLPI